MSDAADILTETARIVAGDRNTTHGEKERSFAVIADLWNAYINGRKSGASVPISPRNVAQMMELLKIARSIQGTPVRDHFVDAAGYGAIAGELASSEGADRRKPDPTASRCKACQSPGVCGGLKQCFVNPGRALDPKDQTP